jgi:hypothetical protein
MELVPGGRLAESEIGPENADPGLEAGLPEQNDQTGGER